MLAADVVKGFMPLLDVQQKSTYQARFEQQLTRHEDGLCLYMCAIIGDCKVML